MIQVQEFISRLSSAVNRPASLRLFCILTYAWFILNALLVWDVKSLLWGPQNIFFRQGHTDTLVENFIYQLIYAPNRIQLIFGIHLMSALLSLGEFRWSFIPRITTWLTALMLYYSANEAFNSGMMIMMLGAFYGSVIYTKATSGWRIAMSNVAAKVATIQVVLVYATAAAYKLGGVQWPNGDALYYALHIERFSDTFWVKSGIIHQHWLMMLMTWMALAYQMLFPIMVWIKKVKGWFLLVGVLFHLFIAFFLHLWDFAVAMIFVYSLFLEEHQAKRILEFRSTVFREKRKEV